MKSLLCVLLASLAVVAAAPHASAAAVGDDSAIAPFVGEGTIVVGRLDIDRIDQDAFNEYAGTLIETFIKAEFKKQGMADEDMAQIIQEARGQVGVANTWMTEMAAAGGKRVYVLLDATDFEEETSDDAVVVVPLGDGADAEKIRAMLNPDGDPEPAEAEAGEKDAEVKVDKGEGEDKVEVEVEALGDDRARAVVIGKAVVFAPSKAIARLKKQAAPGGKPVARPELSAALDAAGDAPLRFAFAPGEKSRTLIEKTIPALPAAFGGGDAKVISRGLRWASMGMTQKPAPQVHLTFRGLDAEKTKALLDTLTKGLDFAKDATAGQDGMEETAKQLAAVNPKLDGETITIGVDPILFLTGVKDLGEQMGGAMVEGEVDDDDDESKPAKKDDGGL